MTHGVRLGRRLEVGRRVHLLLLRAASGQLHGAGRRVAGAERVHLDLHEPDLPAVELAQVVHIAELAVLVRVAPCGRILLLLLLVVMGLLLVLLMLVLVLLLLGRIAGRVWAQAVAERRLGVRGQGGRVRGRTGDRAREARGRELAVGHRSAALELRPTGGEGGGVGPRVLVERRLRPQSAARGVEAADGHGQGTGSVTLRTHADGKSAMRTRVGPPQRYLLGAYSGAAGPGGPRAGGPRACEGVRSFMAAAEDAGLAWAALVRAGPVRSARLRTLRTCGR